MQVFSIAMNKQNMKGIQLQEKVNITVGQYADDSTIFGNGRSDYIKLRNAVNQFESASGMVVNWDKSIIMMLGNTFELYENDQIKLYLEVNKQEYLGL